MAEYSTARMIGGAVGGFVRGLILGFVFLFLAIGAGTFPIVGWAMAVGLVGMGLISPFLGAWLGYKSRQ